MAVVTVGFTAVVAVVVGVVVLVVVAGEVAGDISDLDEVSCTFLIVEVVTTVAAVVVGVVVVVMGMAVVVDEREVTVVAGLLCVDVLDVCKVVRAIGVMVEGFIEVGLVTAV